MQKTEVNKSGRWKFRTEVLNGQCTYLECRRAQSQPARSRSIHPYSPSSFARHPTATKVKAFSPSRYRCECVSNWRWLTNEVSSGYLQGGVICRSRKTQKMVGAALAVMWGPSAPGSHSCQERLCTMHRRNFNCCISFPLANTMALILSFTR
jgi:hypothetical protein